MAKSIYQDFLIVPYQITEFFRILITVLMKHELFQNKTLRNHCCCNSTNIQNWVGIRKIARALNIYHQIAWRIFVNFLFYTYVPNFKSTGITLPERGIFKTHKIRSLKHKWWFQKFHNNYVWAEENPSAIIKI